MAAECPGCGAPLQSDDPAQPGYVPPQVVADGGELLCQRCFRIRHYGRLTGVSGPDATVVASIRRAVQEAAATVMLVDVIDFEGSFRVELAAGARRLVVAVNKVDLLPSVTPRDEVAEWVWQRLEGAGLHPQAVCLVSAARRYGVRGLMERLHELVPSGAGRVALVGATNVGKSTLVRALLGREEAKEGPTVARFPGTTLGLVLRRLEDGLELVDTPGLVPGDRLTDRLCPACAAHFVPARELASRLYRLVPGQALGWGGIASVTLLEANGGAGDGPGRDVLLFSGEDVQVARARPRPEAGPDLWPVPRLQPGSCANCRQRVAEGGWQRHRLQVPEMADVAVYGLGWLSVRGGDCQLELTLPVGVTYRLRPRLVGPKVPRPRRAVAPAGRRGPERRP